MDEFIETGFNIFLIYKIVFIELIKSIHFMQSTAHFEISSRLAGLLAIFVANLYFGHLLKNMLKILAVILLMLISFSDITIIYE